MDNNNRKLQLIEVFYSYYEQLINQAEIVLRTDTERGIGGVAVPNYTVTIQSKPGVTVKVITYRNGFTTHTSTFSAPKGTAFTVSLEGENSSKYMLSLTGGVLVEDVTISLLSKEDMARCAIIIDEPFGKDQLILTKKQGSEYLPLDSYFAYPGDRADFIVHVPWKRKYDPGILNITSIPVIQKNTNMIYATPPVLKSDFDPNIVEVTVNNKPHQTIHVYTTDKSNKTTDNTNTFRSEPGIRYTIESKAEPGWVAGDIHIKNIYGESMVSNGKFDIDAIVTVDDAKIRYTKIKINQKPHQTIKVKVWNEDGTSFKEYTDDALVQVNSKFEVTITPDDKYNAGRLNITSGRVPSDGLTIFASDPIRLSVKVFMNPSQHGTYFVNTFENGRTVKHTNSFTVDTGVRYEIISIPDMWYNIGFNIPVTGTFSDDTTIEPNSSINTDYEFEFTTATTDESRRDSSGFNVTKIWNPNGKMYGSISKYYIMDMMKFISGGSVSSNWGGGISGATIKIAFWGDGNIQGLFKTCTLEVLIDGTWYKILNKEPNRNFDSHGDFEKYMNFTRHNKDIQPALTKLIFNKGTYKARIHIDV